MRFSTQLLGENPIDLYLSKQSQNNLESQANEPLENQFKR
jgi:hypothetical protein